MPENRLRITPAWAGKRFPMSTPLRSHLDHPRMGGEKATRTAPPTMPSGSPPHGRGKDWFAYHSVSFDRITPAWAGKSQFLHYFADSVEDHPRMGGEKGLAFPAFSTREGSPPHGRGKVCTCCCASPLARITPAWAGKSEFCVSEAIQTWDHPRMGGEKAKDAQPSGPRKGSPPHGRGKGPSSRPVALVIRITPAWAGKRVGDM